MKKSNGRIRMDVFNSYYHIYAIIFSLLITLIFHFSLNFKLSPKAYETISIFMVYKEEVNDDYSSELQKSLKKEGLKKVNYYIYEEGSSDLVKNYKNYGKSSDFLILQEKDVVDQKEAIKDNFMAFDNSFIAEFELNTDELYKYDENYYAIKIFSKTENLKYNFSSVATFSDDTYLLVNMFSYHYDIETNTLSDLAKLTLKTMLQGMKNA